MQRFLVVVFVVALSGCASHVQPSAYTRVDGKPADAGVQAMLAQCKGEAATAPIASGGTGLIGFAASVSDRTSRENSVLDACMARNGYVR